MTGVDAAVRHYVLADDQHGAVVLHLLGLRHAEAATAVWRQIAKASSSNATATCWSPVPQLPAGNGHAAGSGRRQADLRAVPERLLIEGLSSSERVSEASHYCAVVN
jgi:hypothetical protein